MTFEQVVLVIQAVGLPLVGWAIRELRLLITLVKKNAENVAELKQTQKDHGERIARLEAMQEAA